MLSPLYQSLLLDIHSRLMTEDGDPGVMLQDLCAILGTSLSYPLVWIALPDEGGSLRVRAAAERGSECPELAGMPLARPRGPRGETHSARCLRMGQPVCADDAEAEIDPYPRSGPLVAVPLKSGEETLGVLGVLGRRGYPFRREERDLLEVVGAHTGFALTMLERFAEASEAAAQQKLAAAVFEFAMEGILITDLEGRIVAANPAVRRISGYSEAELLGATPRILRAGRHEETSFDTFWGHLATRGHWRGEVWNRRKSGEEYPGLVCASAIHDDQGRPVRYVALLVDISAQKQVEARLERKANHDELTGLPNRGQFQSYLGKLLARARREQGHLAVLFLDLDGFKYVNDTLGHHEGDELIRAVAERLAGCLRTEDMVARLGGDEFAVVLPGIAHMQEAATVARKLLAALSAPVTLAEREVHVTASAGIALYPNDGDTVEALLRRADNAMYSAKDLGSNTVQFYRAGMDAKSRERLDLGSALKTALERGDLFLTYQPQVDVRTGRLVGAEALLRWAHQGEVVYPERFIPIAEETGLIVAIGDWALRSACLQGRAWHDQGLGDLRLSVNLSARQFKERSLLSTIRSVLDETGFPAFQLDVELTESLAMGQGAHTGAVLGALKEMGVGIAIDDFGTGYSSLSTLGQYPLDTLKIDLSFVQAIGLDPRMEAIIRTVIAMARTLGLKLIAEGAETAEQLDFLRSAGCEVVQGYLLGEPMPPETFEARFMAGLAH